MSKTRARTQLHLGVLLGAAAAVGCTRIVPPAPDTSDQDAPTVGLICLAEGQTVAGTVRLKLIARDRGGSSVERVSIIIDGVEVASSSSEQELVYEWNTASYSAGAHTVAASATDRAGNEKVETRRVAVNPSGTTLRTTTVSGRVYAPNGKDPIAGALVWIAKDDLDCEPMDDGSGPPPDDAYCTFTYSGSNGDFTLAGVPNVCPDTVQLEIKKGAFRASNSIFSYLAEQKLTREQTTLDVDLNGIGKLAVVTGAFDDIENTLAKLGLGAVDPQGTLVPGTEKFQLVDGDDTLANGQYPDFVDFITNPSVYSSFRTIFINCGNLHENALISNVTAMNQLRDWIRSGGHLYCTDLSYDFCEQLFPEQIAWEGSMNGLSTTPEIVNSAQIGDGFALSRAQVTDPVLADWLSGIGVRNSDGTTDITGWLGSWAVMKSVGPAARTWVTGPVEFNGMQTVRPLSVTFREGLGAVFVSSYHTSHEIQSTEPTPQERILQYIILEVL